MKKLEVDELENLNEWEKKVFKLLENFNLENISTLTILPEIALGKNYTFFSFKTKTNEKIHFYYEKNQKIISVKIWIGMLDLGDITMMKYGNNKNREKWLNSIWEQFVNYFNLRIRLLFINETTPWKWKTEFIY